MCKSQNQIVKNQNLDSDWLLWEGLPNNHRSRPKVFCKKGAPRNFAKFIGKHLCQSLFFNKDAGLRAAALLKKRLWHKCFTVNFAKFLKALFLKEHLWWLLLSSQNVTPKVFQNERPLNLICGWVLSFNSFGRGSNITKTNLGLNTFYLTLENHNRGVVRAPQISTMESFKTKANGF